MKKNDLVRDLEHLAIISIVLLVLFLFAWPALAQSGLEGRIQQTINDLVRIINILIVGFVAWAGFLIAKGENTGVTRLIYGIVGLVVVNAAHLIIHYFN